MSQNSVVNIQENEIIDGANVKFLKREPLYLEFESVIPAQSIIESVEEKLLEVQKTFVMAGYREGRVPLDIIRKNKGAAILTELIEKAVDDKLRAIFEHLNARPALQPQVDVNSFDQNKDLRFICKVELYPTNIPNVDWNKIELDNVLIDVLDSDVSKSHEEIIKNFKNFDSAPAGYAAKKGDAVLIDFIGKVQDKEFEGGKAEDFRLELGSGEFIPGFEDQLIGSKVGNALKVRVVFPKNYQNKQLAGKPGVFDVTVKDVLQPSKVTEINDDFAVKLGVENLEKLNELIKQKLEGDFAELSRLRLKKKLFDMIDAEYQFEVPAGMLKLDFESMWNDLKAQKEKNPKAFQGKTEEEMKVEYLKIAARRVRLGIILAEIAKENNIEVTDADLQQAMFVEAMKKPGQEKMILDFYSKPENLERLRGPLLEEKAVDFILQQVTLKEVAVTSSEFFEKYAPDLNPSNNNQ